MLSIKSYINLKNKNSKLTSQSKDISGVLCYK